MNQISAAEHSRGARFQGGGKGGVEPRLPGDHRGLDPARRTLRGNRGTLLPGLCLESNRLSGGRPRYVRGGEQSMSRWPFRDTPRPRSHGDFFSPLASLKAPHGTASAVSRVALGNELEPLRCRSDTRGRGAGSPLVRHRVENRSVWCSPSSAGEVEAARAAIARSSIPRCLRRRRRWLDLLVADTHTKGCV